MVQEGEAGGISSLNRRKTGNRPPAKRQPAPAGSFWPPGAQGAGMKRGPFYRRSARLRQKSAGAGVAIITGMEAPTLAGPADPDNLFGELEAGLAAGASDWQFRGGEPCWIRVGGDLRRLDQPPLPEPRVQALAMAALGSSLPIRPETDAAFAYGGEFFRLHAYSAGGVFCCNLRHISSRIRPLDELGVPPAVRGTALASPRGLILVTGPAGSGKSTTLAAAIDHLNSRSEGVILTFEDPIEFRHRSRRCLVRQMQRGLDFETFAGALRGSLRSDPDVILVGEMRDTETVAAALHRRRNRAPRPRHAALRHRPRRGVADHRRVSGPADGGGARCSSPRAWSRSSPSSSCGPGRENSPAPSN